MMQHIYTQPQFGENWFGYEELYKHFVEKTPDGGTIVEVGCWKGKSISFLGVEIANSGKNIKCYGVDTWKGSGSIHDTDPYVRTNRLYELFLGNTSSLKHIITPIRLPSIEAAKQFEDNSLDAVFIDANHDYENVKADINAWYPKVKSGGIISGHDYSPIAEGNGHPGVRQAVHESFPVEKLVVYPANCSTYLKP